MSTQRSHTQPFVVVASLLEKDKKILLVKQVMGQAAGLWDLPAGWVDLGENPIQAAKRETEEETGLEFTPTALVGIQSYVKRSQVQPNTVIQPVIFLFRGTWTGDISYDGGEVSEHGWFSESEIEVMDEYTLRSANIKQAVHEYFAGIHYPLQIITHLVQPIQEIR